MTSVGLRRVAGVAAHIVAVAVAMYLLWMLAGVVTRHALRRQAGVDIAAWRAGTSPWHWILRQPGDVLAGRAFGNARLQSMPDGLGVRSLDDQAFEIGLPLTRDADLLHTPRLRVRIDAAPATQMWLVLRQRPHAMLCLSKVPLPGVGSASWSLPQLDWRQPDNTPCPAPTRVAMLRLRLQQPAGALTRIRGVTLLPAAGLQVTMPARLMNLPADPQAAVRLLQATWSTMQPTRLPWVRLPAHASPAQLLALRDLVQENLPAAIVLPAGAPIPASTSAVAANDGRMLKRVGLLLYALAMLYLVLRPPPPRWRALAEIAACLCGPLWLIVGMHLRRPTSPLDMGACVLGLLFAVGLQWRVRPCDWRWSGDLRAWLLPLALLPAALIVYVSANTSAPQQPDLRHALVYFAWAGVQQWLMLAVVLGRLRTLLPSAAAVLACAALFALLHTPNAALMQLCLLAELWWAWCFTRARALLPVALAHALCALVLQASLSGADAWLRSLEVSARYIGS